MWEIIGYLSLAFACVACFVVLASAFDA